MNVELVNPFVESAISVLDTEVGGPTERGTLALERSAFTVQDVTVIIGVAGQVRGFVVFGMSQQTAVSLVSAMIGQEFADFDELAQSGVAEMCNVIAGGATITLAEAGFRTTIAPPVVLTGKGSSISTLDITRLLVPIKSRCGTVDLQVAIRKTS